jgi:hypothetical protein
MRFQASGKTRGGGKDPERKTNTTRFGERLQQHYSQTYKDREHLRYLWLSGVQGAQGGRERGGGGTRKT